MFHRSTPSPGFGKIRPSYHRLLVGGSTVLFLAMVITAKAANMSRLPSGSSTSSGSTKVSSTTSQTTTAATSATAQTVQTTATARRAIANMTRTVTLLQNQQSAQNTARNLSLGSTTGSPADGLATGAIPGLVPTDPSQVATQVQITPSANGTSTVNIVAGTAITLPTNITGTEQITVSGTGSVGTVTTGSTVTTLTGGTATTITPGSTISLPKGGTVTFAAGSASAVPAYVYNYSYGTAPNTSPVPAGWTGISGLSQAAYSAPTSPAAGQTTNGETTVTITQTSQQAVLTWQNFNIGSNTVLDFDQSAGGSNVGQWVAINKVAANVAPSQVFGAIQAPGQVYVINQNGIIFNGTSQVNTGALVVSSLPINDNLVSRGLLNNPDLQFLFSQVNIAGDAGGKGTPYFYPSGGPETDASGSPVLDPVSGNQIVLPASAPAPTGGVVSSINGTALPAASGVDGDIIVQAGAQLSSPTNASHVGGKIALIGTNVSNAGTISTPDGQTILAAGQQVGFESHPSASSDASNPAYGTSGPSLRGLDTYVGAVGQGGTVTNSGTIDSERADITLVGKTIDQDGIIESTTSVSLNGRIDLLADYGTTPIFPSSSTQTPNFYPTLTGTVNLGTGSLTSVLPELTSTDTVVGSALALQSQVNIQGKTIDLASNSTLWAPEAAVVLDTGTWLSQSPGYSFANTSGQISLASGATIDVSGVQDVSASVTENIISGQLLGTELANSPLQQNGPLRGLTVEIDDHNLVTYNGETYVGTALADLSGYVNLVQHSVGELSVNGGTVSLTAGSSVNLQSGSEINVSGGWINYQGAEVQTTELVTATGQVVNISKALPNVNYSGVYTGTTLSSSKWNVSQTSVNPTENGTYYDPGYVQGGNGGSISITAPAITVSGNLYGNTTAGALQRSPTTSTTNAGVESWMTLPTSSSLSLIFQAETSKFLTYSPAPPDIVFEPASGANVADPFAGSGNPVVDLSASLVDTDGFANLTIVNSNSHFASGNSGAVTGAGNIAVPAGVSLITQAGGSITFTAANILIGGEVEAPGGTLSFTAEDTSPFEVNILSSDPPPDPTRGQFTLQSQAVLDSSGLIVNDQANSSAANTLPLVINGGSIAISGYNVDLQQGSKINVSGGGHINSNRSVSYGNGGSLSISAGEDQTVTAIQGGQLILQSELDGLSGGKVGSSLSILAPLIQIGGNTLLNGDTTSSGRTLWINPTDASGNLLGSNFFDQGGFSSFTLQGIGAGGATQNTPLPGVLIAPKTTIAPEENSLLLTATANGGYSLTTPILPLADQAPISLSFGATGITDTIPTPQLVLRGDVIMDAGATIQISPNAQSKVSFSGSTVTILGQVIAPGGGISVSGGTSTSKIFFNTSDVLATVDLGPNSVLSTAGATLLTPNNMGYQTGTVLNGGTIKISGNVVAEQGALLDVSGASNTLDVASNSTGTVVGADRTQSLYVPTLIDSNGGTITFSGGQELYVDATLKGYAGGITAQGGTSSAVGGSLVVSSGIFLNPNVQQASLSILDQVIDVSGLIVVTPSVTSFPDTGFAVIGANVPASAPLPDTSAVIGYGHFAASSFNQSGLDSLTLNGNVLFSGTKASPVTLTTKGSLTIATGGVILADDQGTNLGVPINLNASYVDLGEPFQGPLSPNGLGPVFSSGQFSLYFAPTWGLSTLNVTAGELVDVGDLSLQKIGNLNVTVGTSTTEGDIRGDGTLDVAGQINLTSAQVYPTTEADFNIIAYNYTDSHGAELGSVTINSTGAASETPLSAGGQLNLYGSLITQDGVLRAPIGTINLGWDGTGSSPIDYLSGAGTAGEPTVNVTQNLTLGANQVVPFSSNSSSNVVTVASSKTNSTSVTLASNTLPSGFGVGSQLLGSTVVSINGATVTLASEPNAAVSSSTAEAFTTSGGTNMVTVASSSTNSSTVTLASATVPAGFGVGSELLGSTVVSIKGTTVTLSSNANATVFNSITSVSAVDTTLGALTIPFGNVSNGVSWIDPSGTDITSGGVPGKTISLSAQNVTDQANSTLNIAGGGDLYAYDWQTGTGGTVDILNSTTSFAIIPGYNTPYAPYYGTNTASDFVNTKLTVGEQVYLNASNGLPAGTYTLLPAGYALLPGAFLVTPQSGTANVTSTVEPSGASIVSGYTFNGLDSTPTLQPLLTSFEVESQSVVKSRAQYDNYNANSWLAQSATSANASVPRLPIDAGQVVFAATATMNINGELDAVPGGNNLITLASSSISSPTVTLASATLPSDFTVGSELLGSTVQSIDGTTVTLSSDANATVSNAPEAFSDNSSSYLVTVVSSSASSPTVTLASATLPAGFSVGSVLLGSTVQSINGTTVTLAANANATVSNSAEAFSSIQGLGGLVDIASPNEIDIVPGTATPTAGILKLDAATLKNFSAASLLIGGFRTFNGSVEDVTVTTSDLNVETGAVLVGAGVTLVSNGSLTINSGAIIELSSPAVSADPSLVLGNSSTAGSGDGVLVRISSDPSAQISRLGVETPSNQEASPNPPTLTIDPKAQIGGYANANGTATPLGSVTLDSTDETKLDPTAVLSAPTVNLDSGQISIQLNNPGPLAVGSNGKTTSGLVLTDTALSNLQTAATALSLLSYSSIDIYGDGTIGGASVSGQYPVASLALHAAEIRGFDSNGNQGLLNGGGTVTINAQTINLDNSPNGTGPGPASPAVPSGTLTFNVGKLVLGKNGLNIDQYANVAINASQKVTSQGTGAVSTSGALTITTPIITEATSAQETITALGALNVTLPTGASGSLHGSGLGAALTLIGASITDSGDISLPSGNLTLQATAGDLTVLSGGTLDVGAGLPETFNDLQQYTSGGQVSLISNTGSVTLNAGSTVNVAAQPEAGNAGSLNVTTSSLSKGTFTDAGVLNGHGGVGGQNGSFTLDVGSLAKLSSINTALETGGFTYSRSIRVRTGDVSVDGTATAQTFNLSTDQGSITVTGPGEINASGATGGTIDLAAADSLTLQGGSTLTVEGQNFSNAGQGGTVTLEAGDYTQATANLWQTSAAAGGTEIYSGNSTVTIAANSTINLSVDSVDSITDPTAQAAALAAASTAGDVTGTLHIRAPQISGANGIAITSLAGQVKNASNVVIEGFSVQDAKTTGTASIDTYEPTAQANATDFMKNGTAIQNRLLIGNSSLASVINIQPGEEIDNTLGTLVLNKDWDLSTLRYGASEALAVTPSGSYQDEIYGDGGAQMYANVEPGILTIRAAGNIIFNGSLTDGFGDSARTIPIDPNSQVAAPWDNTLLQTFQNGAGQQSWSYRITAGADLTAANFQAVLPLSSLAAGTGSVEVGLFAKTPSGQVTTQGGTTANAIYSGPNGTSLYQVIRTGTGDITISAGRNVQLDNQFATIYTAGTQAPTINNFDLPVLDDINGVLFYPAQYSQNGGNVSITARNDIEHLTEDSNGTILTDSERELPSNWLYRRGDVNSSGSFDQTINGETASTSWWIDYSNFFEGVGALGGGNVTMIAGNNVANVDAVIPTNARMTNQTTLSNGTVSTLAADQPLLELGGGNLLVQAGNDINAGVYYVEHGEGTLDAGNQILTNETRAPSLSTLDIAGSTTESSYTWLPTTLFLGGQQTDGQGSSFTVSSNGDLLIGPTVNPFLLPSGIGNSYWDKTYFSTYATNDSVTLSSLTGSVTLRDNSTLTTTSSTAPANILDTWYSDTLLLAPGSTTTAAYYQPWLALDETALTQFGTVMTIQAPTLNVTSYSGDIDVVGDINLSPAPDGTINLLASGSINSFQPDGYTIVQKTGQAQVVWASSQINLSDANPASVPGVNNPYAYQSQTDVGPNPTALAVSDDLNLSVINDLFAVTGSTTGVNGVLQTQEELHAPGILHINDSTPIHIYAQTGDISGLNLFSGKAADIVAGQDITDIAFYLQNDNSNDISLIEAGRNIYAYDLTSSLRQQVNLTTSVYSGYNSLTALLGAGSGLPNNGDIQIAGPGTLEVLAASNLNLGVNPSAASLTITVGSGKGSVSYTSASNAENADGTGVGLVSIGSTANPYLGANTPGADIIAGSGLGATGFQNSQMNVGNVSYANGSVVIDNPATFNASFSALFLQPGTAESSIYLPQLGAAMGLPASDTTQQIWTAYSQLSPARQDALAVNIFYLVLRDAGRDHNSSTSPFAGTYTEGYAAIKALFPYQAPAMTWPSTGDISLTSREIKTTNGGNISLLAPGGQVNVGVNITGTQPQDQGILTTDGGGINIFANSNVNVGTSRIFTLHGGSEILWSTNGNIDAGSSSKTVQSAPPTRVLIDPQSAEVETDLGGLATGGGIGVLETLVNVPPADVDLIAPTGVVNAGDAGIRASGNLNIAATRVLNAGNISVGGKSSGVPTTSAPNIAGLTSASNTAGAGDNAAADAAKRAAAQAAGQQSGNDIPSLITVEVIGYGGGDDDAGA